MGPKLHAWQYRLWGFKFEDLCFFVASADNSKTTTKHQISAKFFSFCRNLKRARLLFFSNCNKKKKKVWYLVSCSWLLSSHWLMQLKKQWNQKDFKRELFQWILGNPLKRNDCARLQNLGPFLINILKPGLWAPYNESFCVDSNSSQLKSTEPCQLKSMQLVLSKWYKEQKFCFMSSCCWKFQQKQ